jgi:hypothetical protein
MGSLNAWPLLVLTVTRPVLLNLILFVGLMERRIQTCVIWGSLPAKPIKRSPLLVQVPARVSWGTDFVWVRGEAGDEIFMLNNFLCMALRLSICEYRLEKAENRSVFLFYGRKGEMRYQGQVLHSIEQRSWHVKFHPVLNLISMHENQLV